MAILHGGMRSRALRLNRVKPCLMTSKLSRDFSREANVSTLTIFKGLVRIFGATVCASPPPEIHRPSEVSETFQEVVTTKLLKVVPEAGLEPARF